MEIDLTNWTYPEIIKITKLLEAYYKYNTIQDFDNNFNHKFKIINNNGNVYLQDINDVIADLNENNILTIIYK